MPAPSQVWMTSLQRETAVHAVYVRRVRDGDDARMTFRRLYGYGAIRMRRRR